MSDRKSSRLILPGLIAVTLIAASAVYFLRPSESVASAAALQPGGLAQGPEEKKGRAGRVVGLAAGAIRAPASVTSVM